MKTKRDVLIGFLFMVAMALAGIACTQGPDATVNDAEQYCRMVWVHHHDPRYGWPDFRGIYRHQCRSDGSLDMGYVYGRQQPQNPPTTGHGG